MRPLAPGERRVPSGANLVDPYGLDPLPASSPPNPNGFGGAGPWWSSPPGGVGPRFLEGIPKQRFRISPFDHVVSARRTRWPLVHANMGTPQGNTGFGQASEVGDLTEGTKTTMTAAFLLGALALTYFVYAK